jgi:uncharacterized protein YjbI with pentapeptide repeats
MANPEHLKILKQGVEAWNKWREENPEVRPDLSGRSVVFEGEKFGHANFCNTNFKGAILRDSRFYRAELHGAVLDEAVLERASFYKAKLNNSSFKQAKMWNARFLMARLEVADMTGAKLNGADLRDSIFYKVNFNGADLSGVNFSGANLCDCSFIESVLMNAIMVNTDLYGSTIIDSNIYGLTAWNIKKKSLTQRSLIITPSEEPKIRVNDLEVAQFMNLIRDNQKISSFIEATTSQVVLILGRFQKGRKEVLEAIKTKLSLLGYIPVIFDFDKPRSRSLTETIAILAKMSYFVIADMTKPKSIPQELSFIIPFTPHLPVVPIIQKRHQVYSMFEHFRLYPSLLPIYKYESLEQLIENLEDEVIAPAEQKVAELRGK